MTNDFTYRFTDCKSCRYNWETGTERANVMNHAYDGLLDLAEILGIPARAISLNGELALAFGARGHGLSGARAHYELDRVVINLTKMLLVNIFT